MSILDTEIFFKLKIAWCTREIAISGHNPLVMKPSTQLFEAPAPSTLQKADTCISKAPALCSNKFIRPFKQGVRYGECQNNSDNRRYAQRIRTRKCAANTKIKNIFNRRILS